MFSNIIGIDIYIEPQIHVIKKL